MKLWHILLLGVVGSLVFVMSKEPIPQPLSYHDFADTSSFLRIPNFLNVATNLPFLLVGYLGLNAARRSGRPARMAWWVMFLGVLMVAFGSGYYHWSPDSVTLVWDRLPMAVGFMGLLVALLTEYVHPKLERYLLWPAVFLGIASVFYWHITDDLRIYLWVQFFPLGVLLLLLPVMRWRDRGFLIAAFALYALAKVTEAEDAMTFSLTQEIISGHSLKHLLAAGGLYAVYQMVKPSATKLERPNLD